MSGVVCPKCGSIGLRVVDSRPSQDDEVICWRMRKCHSCDAKFKTHEIMTGMDAVDLKVIQTVRAVQFVREVEKLARALFGNEDGKFHHKTADTRTIQERMEAAE